MSYCAPPTVQQPSCEPYVNEVPCCPPKKALGREVCPVKVPVGGCEVTHNSCDPCECVPCWDDPALAMTPEVKAAFKATINALLQTISPVDRCDCKVIEQVGHDFPLKPPQTVNEDGMPLYEQVNTVVNPDGSVTSTTVVTTSAVHTETGLPNCALFEECCAGGASKHSAFINNGMSSIRYKGGNGPGFMGAISDINSREFHDKMGELFCCALEKVDEAPEMTIVTP